MRFVSHVVEHRSRSDVWYLKPLGDIHLGSVNCDEELLKKDIEWIEEKGAWWWGMGDMAEFISRKDRRFRPEDTAPWCAGEPDMAEAQVQRLLELFTPIRDQCLGLLKGNHEDQIYDHYENDVYARLLQGMKTTPNRRLRLDTRGFIRLKFKRMGPTMDKVPSMRTIDIYCEHGYGGGRLEGAPALALGRLSKNYKAHIYATGHRHVHLSFPDERIRVGGEQLVSERILFLCTGTYLKSWEPDTEIYAERKQYPPKPTGSPTIVLQPWARGVERTMRLII